MLHAGLCEPKQAEQTHSAKKSDGKCACTQSDNGRASKLSTCGVLCRYLSASEQKDLIFRKSSVVCANSIGEKHNRVIPAKWWRVWCDFVNIEYKSIGEHFKTNRAQVAGNPKCSMKDPMSTVWISEESDIDFDLKSYQHGSKQEAQNLTNRLKIELKENSVKPAFEPRRFELTPVNFSVISNTD